MADMIKSGMTNEPVCPHQQDEDAEQGGSKGQTEITEHIQGDLPFPLASPFGPQRRMAWVRP